MNSLLPRVLRSKNGQPLSMEMLEQSFPSIFAKVPHESRSDRYVHIPTFEIVQNMHKEGFFPVAVSQAHPRDVSRRDFCKHMIRFRRDGVSFDNVGDAIPEVVLVNSHDGTSRYKFFAGLFRLVCSNGMVVEDTSYGSVSVKHSGDGEQIMGDMIEGAYEVLEISKKALEAPKAWAKIELNRDEKVAFAESARIIRLGDKEGNVDSPIKAERFLHTRRREDVGSDLWTVFNVVQENCMKGGLSALKIADDTFRHRRVTTRAVYGIDQDVKINKALWTLGEQMAKLKQAA